MSINILLHTFSSGNIGFIKRLTLLTKPAFPLHKVILYLEWKRRSRRK